MTPHQNTDPTPGQPTAQVLIDTDDFDGDFAVLTDEFGLSVDAIWPADAPAAAVLSGYDVRVRLVAAERSRPVTIALVGDDFAGRPSEHRLPGGTRLLLEPPPAGYRLPSAAPEFVVTTPTGSDGAGRAGMRYLDLLPNRWGGRYISSLISIPDGGPVPDYVHYHRVRFQLIFVKSGWVRVVYEDQGDPFVMAAGDAVLQVPEIRHRVIEASPGLEVIEITSPAEHITLADHGLPLPNGVGEPARRWDGQAFVRHIAEGAVYEPWDLDGWECRDTGIESATSAMASVRIARPAAEADVGDRGVDRGGETGPNHAGPNDAGSELIGEGEFRQLVVVSGAVTVQSDSDRAHLTAGAAIAIPPGIGCSMSDPSHDCEVLDVIVYSPR